MRASMRGARRPHGAGELAETDTPEGRPLAPGAEGHAIPILEEGTLLAARERYGVLTAAAQLEERARLAGGGSRLRAAAEEIAGLEVAAVDRVVGHHLRHRPPGIAEVRVREALRRESGRTHARGLEPHFELEVEAAGTPHPGVVQVGKRRRLAGRASPGSAKGGECLERHHAGRERGGEVLGEKRPERLVLPRLDVACRPVVQQAEAEHVLLGCADRDGLPELVAAADKGSDLELVIESARRGELGHTGARRLDLPGGSGYDNARGA